jgi:hypothetical protein
MLRVSDDRITKEAAMPTTPNGTVAAAPVATAMTEALPSPLPPGRRQAAATAARRRRLDEARSHIGRPSGRVSDRIWLIAICAFAAVLVGSFLTLAISVFVRVQDATSAQVMLTVFTAVLGFLAGLFTPSPVAGKAE